MSFFKRAQSVDDFNKLGIKGIDKELGLEVTKVDDVAKSIDARFVVSDQALQPFGLLHGGVSCLVAESIASIAGNMSLEEPNYAVGQTLSANHLSSGKKGDQVNLHAYCVHWGQRSQVWNVDLSIENRKICQVVMGLAVISR